MQQNIMGIVRPVLVNMVNNLNLINLNFCLLGKHE